ncbi:MAG: family 78 glycoside hydrolase catalytic domain [Lachnospiraceae bacterium]|nr:family 78 glycoside hydrolase catalytic domain [Lachnospiraceae bacterium]
MKAVKLKTEYMTNPIGIDVSCPRFSWVFSEGKEQSAYRIVAKDDAGNLLWDSGKVRSNQMHLIPWQGEHLKSRTKVVWNVTVWDEKDVPESSDTACFEMGLLKESDWQAKWIAGNYTVNKKKRYPVDCFRKSFYVPEGKEVLKARAYMTACGIYEGSLNGKKMGDFCLAPGITDYRKRVQYQTADITELVRSGENTLTFMLADGWYRGSVGAWGMKNYYGKETKLLAQVEVTFTDGSVTCIATDDSFHWTNEGPIRFADNKDGEIYDAGMEDFKGATWDKAKVTTHPIVPVASNNFALGEHERFVNPKLIITPSGKKVLDFGQNIAGYVEFHVNAKAGQRIFLRFGEKLDAEGEFTQHNIQCVKKDYITPLQQVEYFCKEGENSYKTRFAIFGFQYMLLETTVDVKPEDFVAIAVYSGFETTFTFDSSNALLNQFVQNTLWSLKNNSGDLPTDCPTRERHGWSGDAQLFVNTASYMVNYMPFAMKYENDLCDWQTKDGNFPQIAPEGGTDPYMRTMNGSVGWSDAGILIPYRMWKKYGDRQVIEKYYDNMKSYAKYMISRTGKTMIINSEKTKLSKRDRKYLYNIGQHYGEWAEPKEVHSMGIKDFVKAQPEVATAYLSYVMSCMMEVARVLGKTEDIPLYQEYRDGAKATYQKLVMEDKYSLDTDRQAKLVRPLYFHLLNEEQTEFAQKRLMKALDNYQWRVGTGFLSTPFILYVLQDIDLENAYRLLENEEKPGWLFMAKEGASTIWEDWEGPTSDNGTGGGIASLNHYSKGAVCEWVFDEMCGIKMAGENAFVIAPHPGGHFTHATMSYDSVYGTVVSGWKKISEDEYSYEITIPANTTATVILPNKEKVTLSSGSYKL